MHRLRRFLIWWVVLTLLWMELVSSTDWAYFLVGLGCAALSSLAALLAHATMDQRYAVDVRWGRWFAAAIPGTVRDTLRLARVLFRPSADRSAGTMRVLELPHEGPRRAAGRRAVAVVVLGLAPGSYVVDVQDGRLLMHEMPGSSSSLAEQVCR
jgi:multisubunit Na+/H+ antiporter MnhE subunit